jgi:hypothetical protein
LLGTMLVVKALVLLLGFVSYEMTADRQIDWPHGFLDIWNRWDAPHYIELARYGYEATGERSYWLVLYSLFSPTLNCGAFLRTALDVR